ncbi:MAG: glutamate synthase large subunit, partial [Sedimentisphaerales bacterium]|nr:glutamate synthase large subunit [Sedimentisphaerales bacterium]
MAKRGLYDPRFEHDACGIGAVANISGRAEHTILEYGKQIILNLHHRGAAGADNITGDGAGILFQVPHDFFVSEGKHLKIHLPEPGKYAVGMVFCPPEKELCENSRKILEESIIHYGMKVLGWRDVPTNNSCLGPIALSAEPAIFQVFVDGSKFSDQEEFERWLFLARRRAGRTVRARYPGPGEDFYISSISSQTINYKGMFMAWQLFEYYPDLNDGRMKTALAVVHQRYSTNTFPSWKLAQPFRSIAHNGEINTLSGNRNGIRAAEVKMASSLFGDDLQDLFPVSNPEASDSACFDNVLELLVRAGRSLPHSVMMMIPEAFGPKYHISIDKRSFYEYHAAIMEPWDGPAAMVFTDGRYLGGVLDRNGLRPSRYLVTTDGLVVMASETGVIEFPPEKIQSKGRLRPGRMFLVDTRQGRIISDNEIKSKIARQKPYRRWLTENRIELRGLFDAPRQLESDPETIFQKMRVFGYTREELNMLLIPMAINGQEPVGSMGNDAALAVLSDQPKLLFTYFKQLFAQVTNPPIDPLREGLVMSLMTFTGKKQNLLEETPSHCRQLKLPHPILTNEDIERLRAVRRDDFHIATISSCFDATAKDPAEALRQALVTLVDDAEKAIREGASLLIVSDRDISESRAPIPSLLTTSALHHGLLYRGLRHEAGLLIESGEPREVMHFCLLIGFGANAINPYLVFESLDQIHRQGELPEKMEDSEIVDNYIAAVKKGILKTMSKMGISTVRSYFQAQLFEAVGLNRTFMDQYFCGTVSRIEGIGLTEIAHDAISRHRTGYEPRTPGSLELDFGGDYHFRLDGERHLWNPITVSRLQHAVVYNDRKAYDEFSHAVNEQAKGACTLRGLFEFDFAEKPVPIEEVEPAVQIVKRFCTGAMSHGSISKEAHECMAVAMNRIGGMSNTGEGGEDEARYIPEPDGDSKNCAIKQVASGRFGVTINYLAHAKEIQIKMAQGAKPGEGGQLPGHKVTQEVARLRYSTPGVTLISPPPHHDIYSIEDLAQLIYDLKCSNPGCKVSVKLVSEVGVGTIAAGVAKGNADEVLISGHDGGTGASPQSSIKHAGCPWELGLAETQQVLIANGLRSRIRVQTDGQLRTGRDVVVGALLGADQFGFGTAALVCIGCTLLRKCHEGACTYGIATQDPQLRKRFAGKPEYIVRYMTFVAEEIRRWMAALGFHKFEDMIGRVDRLKMQKGIEHYKAKGLDFSRIFQQPQVQDGTQRRLSDKQVDKHGDHLDFEILKQAQAAIDTKQPVKIELPVRNTHRTVGTMISNRIAQKYGSKGLPDGSIDVTFKGSAGQSFGAFLAPGVTLRLIGDSNDYLGKGLSGGRIVVKTPDKSPFIAHRNIIVGNTLLYGATSGEVFINGMAGERFAVRNSGALAVVEGVGDHGCEYMTGGTVVILGETGCNFAAGMSGGIAYVLDEMQLFDTLCNLDMVELEMVWQEKDKRFLRDLVEKHLEWTGSKRAQWILKEWNNIVGRFVKVIP